MPEKFETVEEFLEQAYAADTAELLMKIPEELIEEILERYSTRDRAEIISFLDYETTKYISRIYDERTLSNIITNMYSDDAADFLGTMSVGKVKKILNLMQQEQAQELQELLDFEEESAGGIMNTQYIAFYEGDTVAEVIEKIRMLVPDQEMIYYIYIINYKKELMGVISVRQLLGAQPDTKLEEMMNENVIKVNINMDQEEVAKTLSKYDLLAVPVVNKHNQLMGIVTVDDALDVIEEEATEDIYKMSATADITEIDSVVQGVKKRIPWLMLLLFVGMISGSVINSFEQSLQAVVALAFFIPVLMGMGGNAGTQSLAVVVRGLATEELTFSDFWGHLWREMKVGFIIATIIGLTLGGIVLLWQGNYVLGIVVGISMFITLLTAVLAGTTIPFIINGLGADPAVAAGPFITTIIDITGLFIYFSIATFLMAQLL